MGRSTRPKRMHAYNYIREEKNEARRLARERTIDFPNPKSNKEN